MSSKDKKNLGKIILIIIIILVCLIIIYINQSKIKQTYFAVIAQEQIEPINISGAKSLSIEKIIESNINNNKSNREEVYKKEEELEYLTKYRNNDELYVGETKVSQEGRKGVQTITMKKTYDEDGNLIKEEQVNCVVTKSSINKIIDIGTKIYVEPPKTIGTEGLSFDMALNKPSGFTIEEFEKVLTDSKDVNKIFQDNAKYFYYIEDEYSINGIFVAAIGIHESGWGTSRIAKDKYNLFGYGAYDANPYNGAYSFEDYSESIDLIARVLVKHYLNPSGTSIYDGEKATGKYYNGNNLSGVNKKYATDNNWAKSVYKYMQYLYGKK